MREVEKAKQKAARMSGGPSTKTIELNWAIDGNDLNHRLNRIREFLEKGLKVEVIMAPKKKGRKATEEEGQRLIERIKGVMGEVEGARENKPMIGKVLLQATIFMEGKVQKEK